MDIRPIRSDADHAAALAEIDRLWDAAPGTDDYDRLDVLATLVASYEDDHHEIGPPDPIGAIEYYLDQRGLSRRDLERLLGGRGRTSDILNRRRPLSIGMIRRLSSELGIPADILIQPYPLTSATPSRKAQVEQPAAA